MQEVLQGFADDPASHRYAEVFMEIPRLSDPLPS